MDIKKKLLKKCFGIEGEIVTIDPKNTELKPAIFVEDVMKIVGQMEPQVKQAACGWQKKKPDKPCYFLHRYNKKDRYPSLFEAYIDTEVLCVANIQDDEFVETMEGFADGQFYIIEI